MRYFWKNILLLIFLGTTVFVVGGYFFVYCKIISIEEVSNAAQRKNIDNEILSKRLSGLDEARQEFSRLQEEKKKLDAFLEYEGEVELLKRLEKLAEETGNEISFHMKEEEKKNVSVAKDPLEIGKKETLSQLSKKEFLVLEVSLSGNWNELLNFLNKLENLPQYLNVIALDIKKGSENFNNNESFSGVSGDSTKKEETIRSLLTVVVYKK